MGGSNKATRLSYAPFWGEKLSMPSWFKREKMDTFNRHWKHRIGLEMIKIDHARRFGNNPSQKERDE